MDEYFRSLVSKYMRKDGYQTYFQSGYFGNLSITNYVNTIEGYPAHPRMRNIYYNCRMFHESPCEDCEFRFRCYTT